MSIVNNVPRLAAEKFGGADKINLTHMQEATGIAYSTVSRWVKAQIERVDFDTLEALCRYFDVQPGDILSYRDDRKR